MLVTFLFLLLPIHRFYLPYLVTFSLLSNARPPLGNLGCAAIRPQSPLHIGLGI